VFYSIDGLSCAKGTLKSGLTIVIQSSKVYVGNLIFTKNYDFIN